MQGFDQWMRGEIERSLHIQEIPIEVFQMNWRDGRFSLDSLQARHQAMAIRTILDKMIAKDPGVRLVDIRSKRHQWRVSDPIYSSKETNQEDSWDGTATQRTRGRSLPRGINLSQSSQGISGYGYFDLDEGWLWPRLRLTSNAPRDAQALKTILAQTTGLTGQHLQLDSA
jgi:hypothetical protein